MTDSTNISFRKEVINNRNIRKLIENKKFSRKINDLLAKEYNIPMKGETKESVDTSQNDEIIEKKDI